MESQESIPTTPARSSLVPMLSPITDSEVTRERRPFCNIVGSTVVAEPEFIHLIGQAKGNGLGTKTYEMRQALEDIAQGKASIETLMALSKKHAGDKSPNKGPYYDLASAAEAVNFFRRVVYSNSEKRGIAFPGIWSKIVILDGQPYAVCSLNKSQNDLLETLRGVKKGNTNIPRYSDGVLDGYNANALYETEEHAKMGSLSSRLAAIIDSTRAGAFEDVIMNPDGIDVGIQPGENFPEGRLFTIVKKKEFEVVSPTK